MDLSCINKGNLALGFWPYGNTGPIKLILTGPLGRTV